MIKAEAVIGPRSTSSCRLRLSRTLSSSALSSMASNPVAGALPESIVRCTRRDSTARLHRPISSKSMYKPAKISFSQRLTVSEDHSRMEIRGGGISRREALMSSLGLMSGAFWIASHDGLAHAAEFANMPALRGKDYGKSKMKYPDYIETESGLQYKDLRVGSGPTPKAGETVVVDWDGYTIGYYGRIFEARNKTKGGSFEGNEKEFFKFRVGSSEVIPAFEEAISGMAPGGVRRIIVPPELGYPDNDYNKKGPSPLTFSGQRALDFVLRNQGLIDKTLLFDIELLKIIHN